MAKGWDVRCVVSEFSSPIGEPKKKKSDAKSRRGEARRRGERRSKGSAGFLIT